MRLAAGTVRLWDSVANCGGGTKIYNTVYPETSAVIEVGGARQEIPNDFVWIFVGGTPPNDFLRKIGVAFGMHDMARKPATRPDNRPTPENCVPTPGLQPRDEFAICPIRLV
jgi:hypothetical protein